MCLSVVPVASTHALAWWVLVALWVLTVLLIVAKFFGCLQLPEKPQEPQGFPVVCPESSSNADGDAATTVPSDEDEK